MYIKVNELQKTQLKGGEYMNLNLERIRKKRVELGYTQEDLSKELGYNSVYSYHRKENGKQPFLASEIMHLSQLFEEPIENFFENILA